MFLVTTLLLTDGNAIRCRAMKAETADNDEFFMRHYIENARIFPKYRNIRKRTKSTTTDMSQVLMSNITKMTKEREERNKESTWL